MSMKYDPIAMMMVPDEGARTTDADSLNSKSIEELREIASSIGYEKNKLYGTSKQALIVMINKGKANDSLSKAIRACDDLGTFKRYANAIRSENYETASKIFRQAEQDMDMEDFGVDKLMTLFKFKFGKNPK